VPVPVAGEELAAGLGEPVPWEPVSAAAAVMLATAPGEGMPSTPGLALQVLSRSLLPMAGPLRAPAVVAVAPLLLSHALQGDLADHSADAALPLPNGANAPADSPELADRLPVRAVRPDLPRRGDEATVGEAPTVEASAEAGTSTPGEGSRGTPGMSQPGSVMVASLRLRDRLNSTDHVFDYTGAQ
jgi:hypothetical protein